MSESAIIGLAGVVVGAFLTGLLQYVFDQRERRQAARTGGRIVLSDLAIVTNSLRTLLKTEGSLLGAPLPTESWVDHREALAAYLTWSEWTSVTTAFDLLRSYIKELTEVERTLVQLDMQMGEVGASTDFEKSKDALDYVLSQSDRARLTLVHFEIRMQPFGRARYWWYRNRQSRRDETSNAMPAI